ncbi:MAG: hypothetical protein AB1782_20925 [Cyanobacteriota bacterium]
MILKTTVLIKNINRLAKTFPRNTLPGDKSLKTTDVALYIIIIKYINGNDLTSTIINESRIGKQLNDIIGNNAIIKYEAVLKHILNETLDLYSLLKIKNIVKAIKNVWGMTDIGEKSKKIKAEKVFKMLANMA